MPAPDKSVAKQSTTTCTRHTTRMGVLPHTHYNCEPERHDDDMHFLPSPTNEVIHFQGVSLPKDHSLYPQENHLTLDAMPTSRPHGPQGKDCGQRLTTSGMEVRGKDAPAGHHYDSVPSNSKQHRSATQSLALRASEHLSDDYITIRTPTSGGCYTTTNHQRLAQLRTTLYRISTTICRRRRRL